MIGLATARQNGEDKSVRRFALVNLGARDGEISGSSPEREVVKHVDAIGPRAVGNELNAMTVKFKTTHKIPESSPGLCAKDRIETGRN